MEFVETHLCLSWGAANYSKQHLSQNDDSHQPIYINSNRSPGNLNILAKISNIQKIPIFQRKVYYIRRDLSIFHFDRPIYSVSIAITKGYQNFVKSHLRT